MDLFSRKIAGWSSGPTIHAELALNAVLMAVRRRRPCGTVIHSDQGVQYAMAALLPFSSPHAQHEPESELLGQRCCRINAVAESFFSSLKKERIKKRIYKNRELAVNDIADYIETFYNRTRRHSHLGGASPEQFEAVHKPRRESVH
jgi:putative transposase